MIQLQQTREEVYNNTQTFLDKIKKIFDQRTDLVLKLDARNEDKGKHGKFENLWKVPFKVVAFHYNNAYMLEDLTGQLHARGNVNARACKWQVPQSLFHLRSTTFDHFIVYIHPIFSIAGVGS